MSERPSSMGNETELAADRPLFGLVLAGGFSRRMGRDKGLMPIGPLTARQHFRQLLLTSCDQVWVSLRPEQILSTATDSALNPHALPDLFPGEGPLGALYSAFAFRPDADWFVLPCDLPNMTAEVIKEMRAFWKGQQTVRNVPPLHALLLRHPERPFPEPLVGIWSCEAGSIIKQTFNKGERAVFRILPKLSIQEIMPADLTVLQNHNTS